MVASVEQRLLLRKKGRRTPKYALEYSKIGGQYFLMPTVEKSPNNRVPTLCVACSWPAHHESDLWARRHETTNVNPPMEPRVRALHPRLLPESSISSPTAGCNPRGEVDSIDSSLPSQPQTALPSPPNAASSACLIFGFPERPSAQEHALSHDLRLKIASRTLAITRKLLPYPLSKPETRTAHTATWDFCPSGTPMCPQTRVWGHGAHHRGALWAPDPLSSCAWQRCQ